MLSQDQLALLRATAVEPGANRVRLAMRLEGLTQVQLSEKTGISQSYISKLSSGPSENIPFATMRTLALHFGCGLDDLFPVRQAVVA